MKLTCPADEAPVLRDPGKQPEGEEHDDDDSSDSDTHDTAPTEIFLPEFHFPKEQTQVEVSSGRWAISIDQADCGLGLVQRLRWWHGSGEQNIKVTGIKRRIGVAMGKDDEEEGYLEQCRKSTCTAM